jgi:hypothetical protein
MFRSIDISNNMAENNGGGIYLFADASINSEQMTINQNSAENYGGGIFLNKTTVILRQMTITNNDAMYGSGLAMWTNKGSLIDQCIIKNNKSAEKGGGIYIADSESPEIRNTIIAINNAIDGGGIYFYNVSTPFVHFSTIADNYAPGSANGIHVFVDEINASPKVNIRSSILWNDGDEINSSPGDDKAMVTYSDIADTNWLSYTGNINSDPLFTSDNTYHLDRGSPCKNNASEVSAPLYDIDSDIRPLGKATDGSAYDIGADESSNAPPVAENRTENILEDTATEIQLIAVDEDGDELTYSLYQMPMHGTITGTGYTRTYQPETNFNGTDFLTFKVDDGKQVSNEATVNINVLPVNDQPEFTIEDNISVYENSGLSRIENWLTEINAGASGHANESNQMITFEVSVDKPELFSSLPNISQNGTITFTPAPGKTGNAIMTVRLKDDGGTVNNGEDTSQDHYAMLKILDINDSPTFTINPDYSQIEIWEDATTQSISQFAQNISPGSETEISQRLWFEVTSNQNHLFSQMPSMHENGTLTFIPAPNAFGTANLSIYLKDDGGTESSGRDTSDPHQCTIEILPVNDQPNFIPGPDISIDEDSPAQIFPLWTNSIPGGANEDNQTLTYIVSGNDAPELFSSGPEITSSGTLTFTPAPNACGTSTITVLIKDNGGTDRNGEDTSNPKTFEINIKAVNDPPSFVTNASNLSFQEDSGRHVIEWATQISSGAQNESDQTLKFHVNTNQQSMFDYPPNVYNNGFLSFTLKPNAYGKALVSVCLEDSEGMKSNLHELTIDITEINDAPSFNMPTELTIIEDRGELRLPNWVDNINPGPDYTSNDYPFNEMDQTIHFLISTNNDTLFSKLPYITADGTLVLQTAPNLYGTALLTVVLEDEGTTNGSIDRKQSQQKTFTLSVTPVNDAPSFSIGNSIEIYEDSSQQRYTQWATNIVEGPSNESDQSLMFSMVSNNPELFTQQPTLSLDGDLVFTPKANAAGTVLVSVVLKDSGGVSNNGQDTSAVQQFTINILPINDAPSFNLGPDITVFEDSGLIEYVNWITQISPGGTDESKQQLIFHVGVQGENDLFVETPEVILENDFGSLMFEPLPNANGEKLVVMFLEDSGTTDNGGVNTSSTQFMTIRVEPVNDPPTFDLSTQTVSVYEDAGMITTPNFALNISPGPPDEYGQSLAFYLTVNNPTLFSIQPQMTSEGTLSFQTAINQSGEATANIYLDDGQPEHNISTIKTFTISVVNVNDEPSFTIGPNQTIKEDAMPQIIPAWASNIFPGASNEYTQSLAFIVEPSVSSLFLAQPKVTSDGTLMYTPAPDAFGTAEIQVALTDDGGVLNNGDNISITQTFTITLLPVNDPPVFTKGPNISIDEDSGFQFVQNWTSSISPGALNESTQEIQFILNTNNDSLFESMPSVDAFGNLSFKPADNAFGSVSVRLYLKDNGGTEEGGIDESVVQEFTITINPVNDRPSFEPGPDIFIDEDSPKQIFPLWATNAFPGSYNELDQELNYILVNDSPELFSTQPVISLSGDLIFTPEPDASGTAHLKVQIKDNGGNYSNGNDTGSIETFNITIKEVNDRPFIVPIATTWTVVEDSGQHSIEWASQISAGAANESHQTLSFYIQCNQTILFEDLPAISPSNGYLNFTLNDNVFGKAVLSIYSEDPEGLKSRVHNLVIHITEVNDPPIFIMLSQINIFEDSKEQYFDNWVYGIHPNANSIQTDYPFNENDQTISFNISSDNDSLFSKFPVIDANGGLSFEVAQNKHGTAVVSVLIKDDGTTNGMLDVRQSTAKSFIIAVSPVNDPPSFVVGPDIEIKEDSEPFCYTQWATDISAGPSDESDQTLAFEVTVDSPDAFIQQPSISTTGDMIFTVKPDINGSIKGNVVLKDFSAIDVQGSSPLQQFTITILPVNDPPSFVIGKVIEVMEDEGLVSIANWISHINPGSGLDEKNQQLNMHLVHETGNNFFAIEPQIIIENDTGTLIFETLHNICGTKTFGIFFQDSGENGNGHINTSETQTATIIVHPVNDPPSFTLATQTISAFEDRGLQTFLDIGLNLRSGPEDEKDQILSFHLSFNNPALFSKPPQLTLDGTLTFQTNKDQFGESKVQVYLSDSQSENSISDIQSFTISVVNVNDMPSFNSGPDLSIKEDAPFQQIAGWATNIVAGPINESNQVLYFDLSSTDHQFFVTQPYIRSSDGTLMFEPAPDVFGTAEISVTLIDDGGTQNMGLDKSIKRLFAITILPINDQPQFVIGPDIRLFQTYGLKVFQQWATQIIAGPENEINQQLSFVINVYGDKHIFQKTPVLSSNGHLSFIIEKGQYGTSTIQVYLKDSGGTSNGGLDTSSRFEFTISVLDAIMADIDNNGFIDTIDLIKVLQLLADFKNISNILDTYATQNGKISIDDAIYIMNKISEK